MPKKKKDEPNEALVANLGVVNALEEALLMAKSGELRSVAITGAKSDGTSHFSFSLYSFVEMVGQLEFLKQTVIEKAKNS